MQELFTPPHQNIIDTLEKLYPTLRKAMPLKEKQYRALPRAIQELSYILTQNRGEMPMYWASPALTSAYFYYFMPWNIVRFSQLLPNLDLPEYDYIKSYPHIIDIGSGTLTLPLALWILREDIRDLPITFYCLDTSKKPMEFGKKLLESLEHNWTFILIDARKHTVSSIKATSALTIASNVANELVQRRSSHMEDTIARFYTMLTHNLGEYSHALCLEVGTRLGGHIIATLHNIVIEAEEYDIIAPCTHHAPCPYIAENTTSWCHFTFADFYAPQWLQRLSHKAKLEKQTLSTSLLHIGNGKNKVYNSRILSSPIYLPLTKEYIRYTCTQDGIGALEKSKSYVQGTALMTQVKKPARIDEKTKAPFLTYSKPKKR